MSTTKNARREAHAAGIYPKHNEKGHRAAGAGTPLASDSSQGI
ncbi:hypothetical protein QM007_00575 [Rothia sp. SD9660Na]|nr:hypothetical protein [Rothia sp. SD9660Na]WHS50520.1 hypothetical protein QM007_00575 [Rothia sp. SD9660Na]